MKRAAIVLALLLAACTTTPTPNPSGNAAPSVTLSASSMSGPAPFTVTLQASASDPDGDPLTYTWQMPTGEVAGGATYQLTMSQPGEYPVGVRVTDGALNASAGLILTALEPDQTPPAPLPGPTPPQPEPPGETPPAPPQPPVPEPPGETPPAPPPPENPPAPPPPPETPPAQSATLKLDVSPENAEWTVGTETGTGDATLTLPAGTYEVYIGAGMMAYHNLLETHTFEAGETTTLTRRLSPTNERFNVYADVPDASCATVTFETCYDVVDGTWQVTVYSAELWYDEQTEGRWDIGEDFTYRLESAQGSVTLTRTASRFVQLEENVGNYRVFTYRLETDLPRGEYYVTETASSPFWEVSGQGGFWISVP